MLRLVLMASLRWTLSLTSPKDMKNSAQFFVVGPSAPWKRTKSLL